MPPAMASNSSGPSVLRKEDMHATEGASLIARAHALNHFIDMQAQASSAAAATSSRAGETRRQQSYPQLLDAEAQQTGCLCFGGTGGNSKASRNNNNGVSSRAGGDMASASSSRSRARPVRQYFPDNLAAQPERHPWEPGMEWVILGCVDFLEEHGLDEPNLFAVSAVDDLVRNLSLPVDKPLPSTTDPHVASGAIKARIRHATEPLVSKACLRRYIESQASPDSQTSTSPLSNSLSPAVANTVSPGTLSANSATSENPVSSNSLNSRSREQVATGGLSAANTAAVASSATALASRVAEVAAARSFTETHLGKTLELTESEASPKRAYVLARFLRLLGRVSAHVETSRMNAHCLAKCVAPSMLHWDPNSTFALLMLGKITAFVMTMIEEARIHDQSLCEVIDRLNDTITPS